jgi:pimeloyl-ACP methyl ester carboxylesterase
MEDAAQTPRTAGRVRTRLVLNFPGFEPTEPIAQLDRIRHGAGKTGEVWGFSVDRSYADRNSGDNHAISEWRSRGPNWDATTRIVQFSWNDVIEDYEKDWHPRAFFRNFPKFMAFFADGTVRRYLSASPRYFAFTIFPLLLIAIFAVVSGFAISWVLTQLGVWSWWALSLLTIAATLLLCKWPGERYYLLLTVNDWGFARDMANRGNPRVEKRYREFARTLAREIEETECEEIIVAGHSFGSLWAVAALALALERRPDLLDGRNLVFLALGSSLLKIALCPKAGFMRDWTAAILRNPQVFWHEIQTKDDIIAFYKADPFQTLGIEAEPDRLRIDRVRYKEAMDKKRYRQMRRSFYRTHRQYILYQDKRVAFDYLLRLFGPFSSRQLADDPQLVASIDPQGRLV